MTKQLAEIVRSRIGLHLKNLGAEVYVATDGAEEIMMVVLGFEDESVVKIAASNDAWSIDVADEYRERTIEMDEYGRVEFLKSPNHPVLAPLVGRTLEGVSVVRSPQSNAPRAVVMRFSGSPMPVIFLNWGDDLWIGNDYPEGADRENFEESVVN
jgi:hypothetical protein